MDNTATTSRVTETPAMTATTDTHDQLEIRKLRNHFLDNIFHLYNKIEYASQCLHNIYIH